MGSACGIAIQGDEIMYVYVQVFKSEVGGVSKPGNLNGSCVRDPFAGTLDVG